MAATSLPTVTLEYTVMEVFQKSTVSMIPSWQHLSRMMEVEATYVMRKRGLKATHGHPGKAAAVCG
jgi:hypothetical protein